MDELASYSTQEGDRVPQPADDRLHVASPPRTTSEPQDETQDALAVGDSTVFAGVSAEKKAEFVKLVCLRYDLYNSY